jgi:hypothetical protein
LALLAFGALLAGLAFFWYQALLIEIERHETRIGEMARAAPRSTVVTGDPRQLEEEIKRANVILRQLTQPWDALFQALESTSARQEKTIALLTIEPDPEKRQVRITGEAKNLTTMLEYVKRLSDDATLSNVYLLSHQVQTRDPDRPVRFSLSAEWKTST